MKARHTKSATPKTVFIRLAENGVAPDPVYARKYDQIIWQSIDGDIEVVFPDQHPFDPAYGNSCVVKANSQTPPYPITASRGSYKYNIVTSRGTFDQGIVVGPVRKGL